MPSSHSHALRNPSFGHGVMMPFSADTLLSVGPRNLGQSRPRRSVPATSGGAGTGVGAASGAGWELAEQPTRTAARSTEAVRVMTTSVGMKDEPPLYRDPTPVSS